MAHLFLHSPKGKSGRKFYFKPVVWLLLNRLSVLIILAALDSILRIWRKTFLSCTYWSQGVFLFYIFGVVWQEQLAKSAFRNLVLPLSMNIFKQTSNNNKIDAEFQRLSSSLWKSYLNNNSSNVSLLFHFMICSITICLSCNYASLKFDPTSFITLPISDSKKVCKI